MEEIGNYAYLLSTSVYANDTVGSDSHSNRARSSSDLSQFGCFTSSGMVKVDKESEEHKLIKIFFDLGMGTEDANVVAIHKNLCSAGTTSRARLERFRSFSRKVAHKHGGNANIVPAWYGGSRDEICDILLNGFSPREPTSGDEPYGVGTIHLSPLYCSFNGAICSVADDNGLRHILLCRVILGETELVSPNSKQALPSSYKLDCGVDDPLNAKRYIVWSDFMNSHICPLYVVSFKAPPPCSSPKSPQKPSIPKLAKSLHPSKVDPSVKCIKELQGSMNSFPAVRLKPPRISFYTTKLRKFLDHSKMVSIVKCNKALPASVVSTTESLQKRRSISFSAHCLKPTTTLKLPKFLNRIKMALIAK